MTQNINTYSPKESIEIVARAGIVKANMRYDKAFMSSVSAGMILSFACATLLSTNVAPWFQTNAPGLIRTIAAFFFPYGLTLIVLTGTDLCTGSFMFTLVPVLQRRLSVVKMLIHWFITFWGNLAGCLFIVAIITGYGGTFDAAAYKAEAISFATTKQVTPEWHQVFLRGIGANWLVCLACYLGTSGHDYISKVAGVWFPIFALRLPRLRPRRRKHVLRPHGHLATRAAPLRRPLHLESTYPGAPREYHRRGAVRG